MKDKPWFLPDFRGFVALGFFLLSWRIVEIIAANPALLKDPAFMQVAGQIMGAGGLLLIAAFLFGASKGASDANARADKALDVATKAQEGQ